MGVGGTKYMFKTMMSNKNKGDNDYKNFPKQTKPKGEGETDNLLGWIKHIEQHNARRRKWD